MGAKISSLCQEKDEDKRDMFLLKNNENFLSIIDDYEYFYEHEIFSNPNENSLFDFEKFLLSYSDYKFLQKKMSNHWKGTDFSKLQHGTLVRVSNQVLAPQWKYLIRKGVPMNLTRLVILDIFKRLYEDNKTQYDHVLTTVFHEQIPINFKNVPTFCDIENLDEIIIYNVLNADGIKCIKRLLWVFKFSNPSLEYSPLLVHTLSLLLIFLSESETYFVTNTLLEDSKKLLDEKNQSDSLRGLRWHFTYYKADFLKFCKSYFEVAKSHSLSFTKLEKHFLEIGFDFYSLFEEWSMNFYFGFLQFSTILQIFTAFINEGIKIHYRISYAICRIFKKEILNHKDPLTLKEEIRRLTLSMSHKKTMEMFMKCYAFGLNKIKKGFSKMEVKMKGNSKPKAIYYPHLETPSEIASMEQFETIWEWLPHLNKLLDLKNIFCSSRDGFSLSHLYKKCENFIDSPMILLIQTDKNYIFGAYSDEMLRLETRTDYYGSDETFVFILQPKEIKFPSKLRNKYHIHATADYFSFGGGDNGVAFQIDNELYLGHTYKSETYENETLNGEIFESSFKCIKIEVYALE